MDPKRPVDPKDVEGILQFEQAAQLVKSDTDHRLADSVQKLLRLIDSHKALQDRHMEGSFSKMEEALSAKKQLFEEISGFEAMQRTALNATTTVLFGLLAVVAVAWLWYRNKRRYAAEEKQKAAEEKQASCRWILTGTEEEQQTKIEKMKKLEETLSLMDVELVRMRGELETLKRER